MLVFSLQRGESFYVADQRVRLLDFDGEAAQLKTEGAEFHCPNHLVDLPGAEGVQVSAGQRSDRSIRIGIQAPFEIKVLRERLYLKDRAEKDAGRPRYNKARKVYADAMHCRLCRGTMLVRHTDEDGQEVVLPCPRKQNPVLPVCRPEG